ncbi:unnamed protein product, partial [Chrysoparadoxa australica]
QDEAQALHVAIIRLLPESDTFRLEARTSFVDVRDRDANVAKSLRVTVATVVADRIIILSSPIVGQLNSCWLIESPARPFDLVCWHGSLLLRRAVAHEVEAELPLLKVKLIQQLHSQDTPIEIQRCLWVFDAEHGLLHDVTLSRVLRINPSCPRPPCLGHCQSRAKGKTACEGYQG